MDTSSFEHIVKLQFNSLMMKVIKSSLKNCRRQFARRSKREVLFCEMSETSQIGQSKIEEYTTDFMLFSELYHVSRSAIYSRRNKGLKKLKKLLNERN